MLWKPSKTFLETANPLQGGKWWQWSEDRLQQVSDLISCTSSSGAKRLCQARELQTVEPEKSILGMMLPLTTSLNLNALRQFSSRCHNHPLLQSQWNAGANSRNKILSSFTYFTKLQLWTTARQIEYLRLIAGSMGIKINKRSLALFLLFLDFSDQPLVRRRGQSGTLVSKLRVKVLKERR